jgi:serine protease AprX
MKKKKSLFTDAFLLTDVRSSAYRSLKTRRASIAVRFLLAALLAVQCIGGIPAGPQIETKVIADSGSKKDSGNVNGPAPKPGPESKLSPDLQDEIRMGRERLISVIVQTPTQPKRGLSTAINQSSGAVRMAFQNIDALAVELPISAVTALASRADVAYVSLDNPTEVTGHVEVATGASLVRNYGNASTGTINGTGIGIAILDSGVYSAHHSFGSRVAANIDFTGEGRTDDHYGHGTHVAAIAAGSNHVSGAYTGIAPAAKLINVRVLNSQGRGSTSHAIAGIDWCITNKAAYNIRVINLSFGAVAVDSYVNDPLCRAVRRAVNAGIVVCVAAGNLGKDTAGRKVLGAIHSPGIEPSAITVGAANTFGTNSRADDQVATYSSRGPTRGYYTNAAGVKHYDNLIKPDLVAPGNKIIAAEAPGNHLLLTNPTLDALVSAFDPHDMMYMSGTSMSTPVVSAAAALMIQRNPALTPNLIKAALQYTAQPLAGFSTCEQGAGLLNIEGAVRLAGLIRQDLTGLILGAPLLVGAAPAQTTTISGANFVWGGGIIQKWNFITGSSLITKYQGIYGAGMLLADGVIRTNATLLADATLLTDGMLLADGTLLSNGTTLGSGTLLTRSTLLADATLLADGCLLADGVLLSDSFMALSTPASALSTLAQSALSGDLTQSMLPELDLGLPD